MSSRWSVPSAALTISGVPFMGPIGGCRVGCIDGEFVLNPKQDELENSTLDLIVAGTREGVLMVESEAQELDEDTMLRAVTFGHEQSQAVIDAIIELAEACAKEPWDLPEAPEQYETVAARVKDLSTEPLTAAYQITVKQDRVEALNAARDAVMTTS